MGCLREGWVVVVGNEHSDLSQVETSWGHRRIARGGMEEDPEDLTGNTGRFPTYTVGRTTCLLLRQGEEAHDLGL